MSLLFLLLTLLLQPPLLDDLLQLPALLLLNHRIQLHLLVLGVLLHLLHELLLDLGVQELLYFLQLLGLLPDDQDLWLLLGLEEVRCVLILFLLLFGRGHLGADGLFFGCLVVGVENGAQVFAFFVGEFELNDLFVGLDSFIGDFYDRPGAFALRICYFFGRRGDFLGVVLLQIPLVLCVFPLVI